MPYLKGVNCECQRIVENDLWEKRLSLSTVVGALKRLGYGMGPISAIGIHDITPAGRVKRIAVRSLGKTIFVSGDALRSTLGNAVIPSVFFELELLDDEAVFSGRGNGHGVGLCQWGAKEMAQRGQDYRSILAHYYPGTELSRIP
jgi:stage II sporulation protein D